MLTQLELDEYSKRSKTELRFQLDLDKVTIHNCLNQRIAEISIIIDEEKIFRDAWFGYVCSDEYKEIFEGVMLDCFSLTAARKKLCDASAMIIGMDRGTSEWYNREFFPKLVAKGLEYNAIISPRDKFARASMEYFETHLDRKLAMAFPETEIGLAWLTAL